MTRFDIKLIRAFVAVAQERSFTRAAQRLHVAQPWLSVQVRSLEEALGFKLFRRNRNSGVELSPQADELLPDAIAFLQSYEALVSRARGIQRQCTRVLCLGAPEYSATIPARQALIERFTQVASDVDLQIVHGWTLDLTERLLRGEVDAALVISPPPMPGFDVLVLQRCHWSLLMPVELLDPSQSSISLASLRGTKVGVFRRSVNPALYDMLAKPLSEAGVEITIVPEPSPLGLNDFAHKTRQPVLTSEWHAVYYDLPADLCVRPIRSPELFFELSLLRRHGDDRPIVATLWDCAQQAGALPYALTSAVSSTASSAASSAAERSRQ